MLFLLPLARGAAAISRAPIEGRHKSGLAIKLSRAQSAAPTKFEAEFATSEMHILVALDVP